MLTETGSRVLFVAESPGRREALLAWLKPLGITPAAIGRWPQFFDGDTRFAVALGPLQDAFALPDGRAVVAEAQIFGLTAPAQQKRRARARDPETLLRDLSEMDMARRVRQPFFNSFDSCACCSINRNICSRRKRRAAASSSTAVAPLAGAE